MSAPLQITDALLRNLARKPAPDFALIAGFMSGAIASEPATSRPSFKNGHPDGFGPYGQRARRHRVYDRTKSRQRKRARGGDGRLPSTIRCWFTEGERAVLSVIAAECKRHGNCQLPVERIAALAGVSVRTVQYALAAASGRGIDMNEFNLKDRLRIVIHIEYRPRRRAKSLPNVITIISREWINWLSYRPSEDPAEETAQDGQWTVTDLFANLPAAIGCKKVRTTEKPIFWTAQERGNRTERGLRGAGPM